MPKGYNAYGMAIEKRSDDSRGGESVREAGLVVPEVEDNRELCFRQGKACVYEPKEEHGIIVAEWPNGVVDRFDVQGKTRTRHWPDGTTETQHEDEPITYPLWIPNGT